MLKMFYKDSMHARHHIRYINFVNETFRLKVKVKTHHEMFRKSLCNYSLWLYESIKWSHPDRPGVTVVTSDEMRLSLMSPHHPGIKRILRILTPESPGDTRVPTLGGETRETPVSGSGTEERPALPPPILLLSYACPCPPSPPTNILIFTR